MAQTRRKTYVEYDQDEGYPVEHEPAELTASYETEVEEAPVGPPVGELLREAREQAGYDIREIAALLRIRPVFVEAIEQGRYADLPGAIYSTGFIRSYSELMGFDAEAMVEHFRREGRVVARKPQLTFPAPVPEGSRVPSGAIIMVAVLVAVVGYAVWYFMSGANRNLADVIPSLPDRFIALLTGDEGTEAPQGPVVEPAPAAPVATEPTTEIVPPAEAPTAAAGATAPAAGAPTGTLSFGGTSATASTSAPLGQTLQPTTGTETPAPAAAAEAPTGIVLRATAETWVQVEQPDGRILYSTVMKAGDSYTVPAGRTDLKFVTGNARGVELTVGGQPVPNWSSKIGVIRNVPLDPARLMGGTAF